MNQLHQLMKLRHAQRNFTPILIKFSGDLKAANDDGAEMENIVSIFGKSKPKFYGDGK